MTFWEWATLAATYPVLLALIVIWIQGATKASTPPPPRPPLPTMTVAVLGRTVARWQIIEHASPDGEVLEFPVFEGQGTWTVDDVAGAIAEIDALPEVVS